MRLSMLGILAGSLISAVLGLLWLALWARARKRDFETLNADRAY